MRETLEETFGIMVYQEQVMRICNRLGDIPLREAYGLIKAIGKKKLDIIAAEKKRFVEGCVKKGLRESQAEEIFDLAVFDGGALVLDPYRANILHCLGGFGNRLTGRGFPAFR